MLHNGPCPTFLTSGAAPAADVSCCQAVFGLKLDICIRLGFLLPSFRAARALWSVLASSLATLAAGGGAVLRLLSGPAALAADMRLRLLLPRTAYGCAAAAVALSAAHAVAARARRSNVPGSSGSSGNGGGSVVASADRQQPTGQLDSLQQRRSVDAARACAAELAAAVAAPLALVLGRRGPLPLLLAVAQAGALLRLLSLRCVLCAMLRCAVMLRCVACTAIQIWAR